MAGGDADIWVCGNCRSVNNLRAKQCYNCRTPQQIAAVDPAAIEGTGHGQLREIALPEFHASRGEAMLASALILVVAGMQVVATIISAQAIADFANDIELQGDLAPGRLSELVTAGFVGLATTGFGLLALTGWAYWLSRIVVAMPALGLGYPAANGLMAFVENFIPGLNLLRVPAIVRDVIRRLEPAEARGEMLIFAAWIGLFGGFILPRVAPFLPFAPDTLEGRLRSAIVVQAISTVLVIFGSIFLVVLIWWIEERIRRRRAAQLAGIPGSADTSSAAAAAATTEPAAGSQASWARPAERAPFAPPAPTTAEPPFVGPAQFAATSASTGAQAPMAVASAAGPLGSTPVPSVLDGLHRPITMVTGTTQIAPVAPEVMPPAAPGAMPPATPATVPAAVPEGPTAVLGHVPVGPHLHLRVESPTSMIATLEGESEPITLDELRAAAIALTRADGSATVEAVDTSFEARALAQLAFEVLSDAAVPASRKG